EKNREDMDVAVHFGASRVGQVRAASAGEGLEELRADRHRVQTRYDISRTVDRKHGLPYGAVNDAERTPFRIFGKWRVRRHRRFHPQDSTRPGPIVVGRSAD